MTCSNPEGNQCKLIMLSNRQAGEADQKVGPRPSDRSVLQPSPGQIKQFGLARAARRRLMVMAIAALFGVSGMALSAQAREEGAQLSRTAAAQAAMTGLMTPAEARTGTLLFKGHQEGQFIEAPRLGMDADITVNGPTARGRLTQHFVNPTQGWVEAVYVFPLPETAAVDTLKMVIGDKIIIGDIKERQEAKVIYERAKAAGQKAALLEQERPNIFTHSIANIGPGESIVLQLEYQQTVKQTGDEFSLRFPMVVAPRYNPKPIVQTVEFDADGRGWGQVNDPVPDRKRISPPVLDPEVSPPVNPVTLTVHLNAGFPLGEVTSHHHKIVSDASSEDVRTLKLADGTTPANRDFELSWTAKNGAAPTVGLFHERVGSDEYILAMITPPTSDTKIAQGGSANDQNGNEAMPREVIFVIDNSGSMGGRSIAQAKASLMFGLERLKPQDRFNIIRFDNTFDLVFRNPVPAEGKYIARAKSFVSRLDARGGTEMLAPLLAALKEQGPQSAKYLRQVVFLTDGAIGNEAQLFDAIAAHRGRSRLFMVGIGSAPNSHLMARAAEIGRGTVTHIGSTAQVEARMKELFAKLENPVVTNLQATFTGVDAVTTPGLLPDLYRGEPVVLAAKLSGTAGRLEISGMIGSQPWVAKLALTGAATGNGISKIWARRKIADAEVDLRLGRRTPQDAEQAILRLALDHHLVSRLTSLVAVDATPERPNGVALTRADVPLNLPDGWDFEKVFGKRGQRADMGGERQRDAGKNGGRLEKAVLNTPANLPKLEQAMMKQIAVAPRPATGGQNNAAGIVAVRLPQTATDAELRLMIGLLLVLLGLAAAFYGARGRTAAIPR